MRPLLPLLGLARSLSAIQTDQSSPSRHSNTIQVWCHDNPKVGPAFPRFLKTLVGADILSTGPLVYWYSKGHKAQGAEQLRAKAAPLIKFLQEQDEEDDSEEDESD